VFKVAFKVVFKMVPRVIVVLAVFATLTRAGAIFPPIHIIGNVYYVGDDDMASYLIVTPKGSILINTGFEYSVPEIRSRVKTLGFRIEDVKILLVTHAHSDHAAGMAGMKRLTGAKVLAMEQEAPLLETGGKTDYLFGSTGWFKPVKVDRTFKDGEKIELGGIELIAHLTPGHTRGSTSYSLDVVENGRTYHVLIANLGSINPGTVLVHNPVYPRIADDYRHTFQLEDQLPCDVFLSSHAGQFGLMQKWRNAPEYSPDRFVDPEGYHRAVARLYERFQRELDQQLEEDQAIQDRKHFKDLKQQ
jgi:metallo-beta-lactamase class B